MTPTKKSIHPIAQGRGGAKRGLDLITAARKVGGVGPREERTDARAIEIGERIRAMRVAKGWTQSVLARKVGWAQGDLSELERGRFGPQGPSYRTLANIADALGIELLIRPDHYLLPLMETESMGEVREANADYCTAHALWTKSKWGDLCDYARNHLAAARSSPIVDFEEIASRTCKLFTLGSSGRLKIPLTRAPLVMAVMKGGGYWWIYSVARHAPTRQEITDGTFTMLNLEESVEIEPSGADGLTMMVMPAQRFLAGDAEDELAC
jgi:transcriptional regulator with XRE-family HTH domain